MSMPNVKIKTKKNLCLSDFSLNDYANANVVHSQRNKSVKVMEQSTDDRNWDDNVDDDIDLVEQEDENGCTIVVVQSNCLRKDFSTCIATTDTDSEGNLYPLDIWFLISKFIAPEDVGRFAGICRATLFVSRSAEFWFRLYKKHYKHNCGLPLRLQPVHMHLRYGLRSCVIRSLYYTYAPFTTEIKVQNYSNFYTPKDLLKRRCLSVWYEKSKSQWIFFFKLKFIKRTLYVPRIAENSKRNVFEILDDILANPEIDCKMLKVHCGSFSDAPPIMGMILNTIFTKVAPNMRHNRLHLGFSQSLQDHVNSTSNCSVVLNNVVKMEVLNWWHPNYPHPAELLPNSIMHNSDNSSASFFEST
ncbi:transmembrane protein 183-like [Arctopsyche grandis]|uniref:transmembrane protein 183-like n=1 Tax=Arctopsyche grandis TaxID=121162 RepID=UPI00406DA2B5